MFKLTVSALAACSIVLGPSASPAQALPSKWRITTAGLGPLKIGMKERQVERVIRREIRIDYYNAPCGVVRLQGKLSGLFSGPRLARIYVNTRRHATRSGVRVGDSEAKVYDTYPGEVVTKPHAYTDGHYLEIHDGNRKVVFETDGRRVKSISTGRKPEIDYVEGCS